MPAADRRPLDVAELAPPPGTIWQHVELIRSTPSSNAELAARAREGAPSGTVLVAEEQTEGRGRLDRSWTAPPFSSLMVSVLVRPSTDPAEWGWIPMLTAVALADTVRDAGASPSVKWPNDVLVSGRKVAGILCEVVPHAQGGVVPAVVAGWGLNVTQAEAELPGTGATSLLLERARTDRRLLLSRVLERWDHWYRLWERDGLGSIRSAYEVYSSTLGEQVRAALPDGREIEGTAVAVAAGGGLVIATAQQEVVVAAADVVHLRPVLPP